MSWNGVGGGEIISLQVLHFFWKIAVSSDSTGSTKKSIYKPTTYIKHYDQITKMNDSMIRFFPKLEASPKLSVGIDTQLPLVGSWDQWRSMKELEFREYLRKLSNGMKLGSGPYR